MQPSDAEIQREVEALRDIKRRSTAQGGPGALLLDPDLPSQSTPPSPQSAYWSSSSSTAVDDSSSSSHESGSGRNSPAEDPFHLFWVPANLHPEIAPDQFRAFLKEHSHTGTEGNVALSRSSSSSSQGLGRKRSMLSRQYKPRLNDGVEEEEVLPLRRDRSSYYANSGPQLTINDLQKLEELAEEASQSDDPSKLRSVLRRSLSLNIAPSVIDQMDDMPNMGDEADAPIIVPPPGQILRRTARTKIRKPGQTTEGSHRRKSGPVVRSDTAPPGDSRTSSDLSSNDHGDGDYLKRPRRMTNDTIDGPSRPESYSEETSIFDAYVTEEPEEEAHGMLMSPLGSTPPDPVIVVEHKEPEPAPPVVPSPVLHHPQPKRLLVPPAAPEVPATSRTPSPEPSTPSVEPSIGGQSPFLAPGSPAQQPLGQRTPSPSQRKDGKDDKGLFKRDKDGKKLSKEKEREQKEKEKQKKGFFGSLFGNKKKQEEQQPSSANYQSGRETAAALLGASKSSKSPAPSPSPQPGGPYARYPIHVERAIYRLSHIKLANPRRPLYEQVLISNLMFWYLGVINKTQAQGPAQSQPQATANGQPAEGQSPAEKEKMEQEQREQEEQERAERERAEREKEMEAKQQPRRGSLTKQASPGTPGRRAEMPVRGPQYELQHRAMEREYGGQSGYGPGSAPMGRAASAPPMNGYAGGYSGRNGSPQGMPQYSQQQSGAPGQVPDNFYYDASANGDQRGSTAHRSAGPQLPPGAMPPVTSVSVDQSWLASSSAPRGSASPRATSPPSAQSSAAAAQPPPGARQSRSPPPNRYTPVQENHAHDGGTKPGRSMSATAAVPPSPSMNGKIRKVSSAHAVPNNHRQRTTSEGGIGSEEDVPLAFYQQQKRR
ncbi:hypothetical protein OE88DRAFT_1712355 [Heliocybe sulcata]|uniref:Protein Zds1 C-terminal domain-containing protein n=1 Tax=Heliocybe sulcata TaxID=5364 RepID=A0A5C3N732_9AGAM|nr:hypothetical protein OE88DRAFT_1712355 [Heliocybe sulcata]